MKGREGEGEVGVGREAGQVGRRSFSPPEFTASRKSGKISAGTICAGWRRVRTHRAAGELPDLGAQAAAHAALDRLGAGVLGLLLGLLGALERAAGLGEEDVVERGRVQLQRLDRDPLGVERPHHLGQLAPRRRSSRDRGAFGARRRRARRSGRGRRPARSRSPGSRGTASTVGRPISAFSSAGVPSATMWPWSMIPTRLASASASSRYWVVRKTVTPSSAASRATSSQSAVRLWMSRPVVGSSRKRMPRTVGEGQRQVEPPLHPARVAADLAVRGFGEADPLEQFAGRAFRVRPCRARAGRSAGACARGRSAAGRAPPPAGRRRSRSAPAGPRLTMSKPATRAVPAVGGSSVVSISTVVDLPAPLGPRKP